MVRNHLAFGILVLFSLNGLARAGDRYIEPADIVVKAVLPVPPAPDSDENKKEIDTLLQLQANRTPQDIKNATAEVDVIPFVFSEVLGPTFNPDDLPITTKFFVKLTADAKGVYSPAKRLFNRPRPFETDPRITPCVEKEDTASYPSGHATISRVWALTLSQIFPDQKEALMAVADRIALDREKAGMHYPSDVEAGKTLADAIFAKLQTNSDFQADLAEVKGECLTHVRVPTTAPSATSN